MKRGKTTTNFTNLLLRQTGPWTNLVPEKKRSGKIKKQSIKNLKVGCKLSNRMGVLQGHPGASTLYGPF